MTDGILEPDVDALPVRILIQQDGFVTGWDDGAMGFEDDGFWFSGRATSFRLVSMGAVSARRDPRYAESLEPGFLLDMGFPLPHPTRKVAVRVVSLDVSFRQRWKDETRLADEIRRWWLRSEADPSSQYPPLAMRPGATLIRAHRIDSAGLPADRGSSVRTLWRRLDASLGSPAVRDLLRALAEDRG